MNSRLGSCTQNKYSFLFAKESIRYKEKAKKVDINYK